MLETEWDTPDGARWRELRDRIQDDVSERGYDTQRATFTQFYGSQGLDAALLLIPRVGFLPWRDERVVGTVEAVQRELCEDGFLVNTARHLGGSPTTTRA